MKGTEEYLLAFSSFYKAAYAQEALRERGLSSSLRRLPPGLLESCGYGAIFRTDRKDGLKQALEALSEKKIQTRGVFLLRREQGKIFYDKIYL